MASPHAMELAVSATSDGRAKDGRGLSGQQESSGDAGDGGCPLVVPRGTASSWPQWHELASLRLPRLPPTPPKHRVLWRHKGSQWSPIAASQETPAWPGLSSSSPSWEHRGKQGAFVCCGRAGLASHPILSTPQGWDASRLGWQVLPWAWGTGTQCHGVPIPAVPAGGGGYSLSTRLGFPVVPAVLSAGTASWLPPGGPVQPAASCAWGKKNRTKLF